MSRSSKSLIREMHLLARQAGGGFKTVADRTKIAQRIALSLAQMNIQIRSVEQMKVRHVELYMDSRKAQMISNRTLKNEMSAIRAIFQAAGRTKLASPSHERLSNQALGIANASRAGTKIALSESRFYDALARVKDKNEGAAIVMQLARYLGLRNEEAVQSAKSIHTWRQALLQGKERVHIVFGTKGGRPRESFVPHKARVLKVLEEAVIYAKAHNGRLIDKPSLVSAKDCYINLLRRVGGLVKEGSNHSMRYAYAQEVEQYYKNAGFTQKEAYALTSMDLGHGDGRGDYIKRVYSQKMAEE